MGAAACWALRTGWIDLLKLGGLEGPALAREAGQLIFRLASALAAVLLALGLIDYGLRYRRFELMLRTTPQEQREDRRVIEGDPATRSQRRRVARAMRRLGRRVDRGEFAAERFSRADSRSRRRAASPRVTVRTTAKGHQGMRLRRMAEINLTPQVDAPELARRLCRRPSAGAPLAAGLIAELTALWPSK